MSTQASDTKGLHLPDLVIKGFRGIEDLTVSRLGQVNLISGRNGVGKTSVLDAVRIYAARGQYRVLSEILRTREEFSRASTTTAMKLLHLIWNLYSTEGKLHQTIAYR